MKIGIYIKELRIARGFTQAELADVLQVSHQAVSRWEKGDNLPDVQKLAEMSTLFEVSIDDIVSKGLEHPHQPSTKNNSHFFFLISIIFSVVGISIFYILLFATGVYWLPILIQYITIIGFSLFYIIPYAQLQTRTQSDFKRIKYGIMITIGSMLLPIHTMFGGNFATNFISWSILVFIVELILFWILSIVEGKQFDQPVVLHHKLKQYSISLLLSIFFIVSIGLLGSGLEALWNWESNYYYIYTTIIVLYSLLVLILALIELYKKFNLITLNLILLYIFASYQLLYIAFWAEPNGHIVPIQQFYAVQDAHTQMYGYFVGLALLNVIILVVQYFKQYDLFIVNWKRYLFFGLLVLFQELVLVFSRVEFYEWSYSNLSVQPIVIYYEVGFVFIILILAILVNEIWTKISYKKS